MAKGRSTNIKKFVIHRELLYFLFEEVHIILDFRMVQT